MLSVAALLVPAGGIAYLGAVSYRDERGAVDAQLERQRQAALRIAGRIEGAIGDALDATEQAGAGARPGIGLARFPFWIDADQHIRVPRAAVLGAAPLPGSLDRNAACASGRLEDCVRELATRDGRVARLRTAQRAEACAPEVESASERTRLGGDACAPAKTEARRLYTALAAFDDTGPDALLGLARLGDGKRLDELDRRFPTRELAGVPVRLVTAALRAEAAGPDDVIALAEAVLANGYPIGSLAELGIATNLRRRVAGELSPAQTAHRSALDEHIAGVRADARAAAGLADDVPELVRGAVPAWRGRPAAHEPARTLVYRRRADGGVVGFSVDAPMLALAAGHAAEDDVALHARVLVLAAGASPPAGLRTIAQVPLGEVLPHLSLAIANPILDPDPLDEVIRARSRRHVAVTSALAVALGLGLLATIRGAARARELARLKSDFVSTVSHELKTPLTSIRMFAEMLEQGVAQGDPGKMARYHHVIVQESQRLGLLIANLLDYAQIERGTRRYTPVRQGADELARHAVATFEILSAADGGAIRNPVTVEVSDQAMLADVEVDRDVVVQALLNLLANAAKYGGADQPIEVAVGADATRAWFAVRDHGPGIPAAEQARIFREFYRAPEAYRSGVEGTGLGLALVKRHVEALGGTVEVASEVGHGATFTIALPRLTVEPDGDA